MTGTECASEGGRPIGESLPQSFVALFHWCGIHENWDRLLDVSAFHAAFTGHLLRLGQEQEAVKFSATGYNDLGMAKMLCLELAMKTGELPNGWTNSRCGPNLTVPVVPLRTYGDFKQWFGSELEYWEGHRVLHEADYNSPATAIGLWDDYRRARAWLKQNDFSVPPCPKEDDDASTWLRTRNGNPPSTKSAFDALADLLNWADRSLMNESLDSGLPRGSALVATLPPDAGREREKKIPADTAGGEQGEADGNPDDGLSERLVRLKAVYDWAMGEIPGADSLTIEELFEAIQNHPAMTSEFLAALPDKPATFGTYLKRAGIDRYNSKGARKRRQSRRPQN
jgi:hypothetical protein